MGETPMGTHLPPPALLRGDFFAARAELETALAQGDAPEVHQLLAGVCLVLEDLDGAQRHAEAAYRGHRDAGNPAGAAAAAILIAEVHEWRGDEAGISGWLARARRLVDEAGECVERGYLELARTGCVVPDVVELEASADVAFATARRFGDSDLEVRALADGGLALVSQGRVADGLARLDEAMAAVVAGDVRSYAVAGMSCCAMLHACDRAGDLDRAGHWADAVFRSARNRFGEPPPVVLQSHCRLMYGTILAELGRWDEAEVQFLRTREGTTCLHYRADASARLAELRIRQGRVAEAAELLAGYEDCREAATAQARLSAARGETDIAAATLRRALHEESTNLLARGPLLSLLVEVELARGELKPAVGAAEELGSIAAAVDVPLLHALAALGAARVAGATGGDAAPHLHAALRSIPAGQRLLLRADVQLELAAALRDTDRGAAIAEARAALATYERLESRRSAGQAAALLRELGVSARMRSDPEPEAMLSRREREVLELVAAGLSNGEIAQRLFITPKTAEHHVSSILGKLGVRTRAEAAVLGSARATGVRGQG
jgi:DNA-binding NarL/FixJ family response regulator